MKTNCEAILWHKKCSVLAEGRCTLAIHSEGEKVRIDIERLLPDNSQIIQKALRHTTNNTLWVILWYMNIIFSQEDYKKGYIIFAQLQDGFNNWYYIDCTSLINFISETSYIEWKEYNYNKLLKYIKKLEKNISEENLYCEVDCCKKIFTFEEINEIIINNPNISELIKWFIYNLQIKSFIENNIYIEPIIFDILVDLLHNSLKYSDDWTKINVEINQTSSCINISVSDEWFWIKKEDIQEMFKYKKRLNNSEWKEWNGIWWTKALYIINKLNWELYVKSKEWVWTKISVILFTNDLVPSSLDPVI